MVYNHQNAVKGKLKAINYSPIAMFTLKSLRWISVKVCLLSIFICIMYYGPLLLISKFSFSIYVNAAAVTVSEVAVFPFLILFIDKMKRRTAGVVFFMSMGITSFILIFVVYFQCEECTFLRVFELVLVFLFRSCVTIWFSLFLVYRNELYPTQIRGTAVGVVSAIGTMASTFCPYMFGSEIDSKPKTAGIMAIFTVLSIISAFLCRSLP